MAATIAAGALVLASMPTAGLARGAMDPWRVVDRNLWRLQRVRSEIVSNAEPSEERAAAEAANNGEAN